jgi:Protein of unknown function (DUF1501)/Planctomycete cytochrome C
VKSRAGVGVLSLLLATIGRAAAPTFQHEILPVLEKHCLACHGSGKEAMAGLDLRTLAGVMAGSSRGGIVAPGNPDASKLWALVRDGKMPMGGSPLGAQELQLIREWIQKGQFPWSITPVAAGTKMITDKDGQWWSFRKAVKPPVPAVRNSARIRNPIDAFLEKKLELDARIANYELAARMQLAATRVADLSKETEATRKLYGLDNPKTANFSTCCLLARRLVENGVRFVTIVNGGWDHHDNIKIDLPVVCERTDRGVAGLIADLKLHGLLDSTLVVWGGEFGRLGEKLTHSDVHATILHLLGLDSSTLTFENEGRNESLIGVNPARVIQEIIA